LCLAKRLNFFIFKILCLDKEIEFFPIPIPIQSNPLIMRIITWRQFEIYERGHHLGTGLRARVVVDGVVGESIEVVAEGAGPWPGPGSLLELAVGVEVGPTVLSLGQEVIVRVVRQSTGVLVGGGERHDSDTSEQVGALAGVRVHWETQHCGPRCHASSSFFLSPSIMLAHCAMRSVRGDWVRLVPPLDSLDYKSVNFGSREREKREDKSKKERSSRVRCASVHRISKFTLLKIVWNSILSTN